MEAGRFRVAAGTFLGTVASRKGTASPLFLDIDVRPRTAYLRAMPVPPDRAWQLPWLRLHLFMRDILVRSASAELGPAALTRAGRPSHPVGAPLSSG